MLLVLLYNIRIENTTEKGLQVGNNFDSVLVKSDKRCYTKDESILKEVTRLFEYTPGTYEIMDAHSHIFPAKIAEKATNSIGSFYDIPMSETGSPEELLRRGAEIGTARYLVCSVATTAAQVASINDFIAAQCAAHPEFFGFGALHPACEDLAGEVEQLLARGLHGVKLHPDFQLFDIDSADAYRIYELIAGRLPVLIHMGDDRYSYSHPERLAKVLRDFPELKVIASHLGGYRCWETAKQLLRGQENVVFDTSSSLPMIDAAYAKELILGYGVERCMFGTDFPMWRPVEELERFLSLGLSEEQNRRILSGTFREFFGL